jgi:hypothetical protein
MGDDEPGVGRVGLFEHVLHPGPVHREQEQVGSLRSLARRTRRGASPGDAPEVLKLLPAAR